MMKLNFNRYTAKAQRRKEPHAKKFAFELLCVSFASCAFAVKGYQ